MATFAGHVSVRSIQDEAGAEMIKGRLRASVLGGEQTDESN